MNQQLLKLYPVFPQEIRRKPYEHTSLSNANQRMRLLLLYPGRCGPLRCSLFDIFLEAAPEYEAISYHWGDPTPTHTIRIGERVLPIAQSTFQALLRVRRWSKFRILWIDGVCISQSDPEEKSQQILLLNRIFKQATCVLVYLGPEADGSQNLPTLFCSILCAARRRGWVPDLGNMSGRFLQVPEYRMLNLPEKSSVEWVNFAKFLNRPWFRRIWVIQEVVLAQKSNILCGNWELSWDTANLALSQAFSLDLPWNLDSHDEKENGNATAIRTMTHSLRQLLKESKKCKFIRLLQQLRLADCSDDKDKIYGMLGLAEAFGEHLPKPDYGKDKITIYTEYARHFIESGDGIEVLYACYAEEIWNAPSWVPNWASQSVLRSQLTVSRGETPSSKNFFPFHAGSSSQPCIFLGKDESALHIDGLLLGEVKVITAPQTLYSKNKLELMQMCGFFAMELEELWKHIDTGEYRSGESRDQVIWRTLICNRSAVVQDEALPEYAEYYQMFKGLGAKLFLNFASRWPVWDTSSFSRVEAERLGYEVDNKITRFITACASHCIPRRRCLTTDGLLGQVPKPTQAGDLIFIPCGSTVPFVIRQKGPKYTIIGECYIHGIMKGRRSVTHKLQPERFVSSRIIHNTSTNIMRIMYCGANLVVARRMLKLDLQKMVLVV